MEKLTELCNQLSQVEILLSLQPNNEEFQLIQKQLQQLVGKFFLFIFMQIQRNIENILSNFRLISLQKI